MYCTKDWSAFSLLETSVEISEDKNSLALYTEEVICDDNEASADSIASVSQPISVPILVTVDNNALSFSRSIPLTKETISANWSRSTVEPSKIASILPFSVLIAVSNEVSADSLVVISVLILSFNWTNNEVSADSLVVISVLILSFNWTNNEPSADIALDSSASTSAILEDVSLLILSFNWTNNEVSADSLLEISEVNLASITISLEIAIDSFVLTVTSTEEKPLEISPDNTTSTDVWTEQHSEISADNLSSVSILDDSSEEILEDNAALALKTEEEIWVDKDSSPEILEDSSLLIDAPRLLYISLALSWSDNVKLASAFSLAKVS